MQGRCINCKYYVATRKDEGICTYCWLYAAHVRAIDYCDCYETAYEKE